jgi:DNA-binding transcriptional LysR family regulator
VGARLIERAGRGIRLTAQGRTLADYSRRILELALDAETALADEQHLRRGRLAIGAGPTLSTYLLPDALVRFRQRFPGITLHLEVGNSPLLRDRLRDGSIELALTETALPSPEFDSTVFMSDQLVGIVPAKHRLARKRTITTAAFAREPFVVRQGGSGTQSLVERVFAERGITIEPVIALSSTEAVKRAVAAGLGVSIISKMAVDPGLGVLNLRDVALRRPIYLVRLASHRESKPATALLCLLRHVARGTLPPFPAPGRPHAA